MAIHIERGVTKSYSFIEFAQQPGSLPKGYHAIKIKSELMIYSEKSESRDTFAAKIWESSAEPIYHMDLYKEECESYLLVLAKRFEDFCKADGHKIDIYLTCKYS